MCEGRKERVFRMEGKQGWRDGGMEEWRDGWDGGMEG